MTIEYSRPIRAVDQGSEVEEILDRFDAVFRRATEQAGVSLAKLSDPQVEQMCKELGACFDAVLPSLRGLRQMRENTDEHWAGLRTLVLDQGQRRNKYYGIVGDAIAQYRLEDAELGESIEQQIAASAESVGVELILTAPLEPQSSPEPAPLGPVDTAALQPLEAAERAGVLHIPVPESRVSSAVPRVLETVFNYAAPVLASKTGIRRESDYPVDRDTIAVPLMIASSADKATLTDTINRGLQPPTDSDDPKAYARTVRRFYAEVGPALAALDRVGHRCSVADLEHCRVEMFVSDVCGYVLVGTASDALRLMLARIDMPASAD